MEDNESPPKPFEFKPLVFTEVGGVLDGSVSLRPERRSGHRIVCDDSNFYSFGGYLRTESMGRVNHRLLEELWCFNFAEGSWKLLRTTGDIPKDLASHAAALYGNYLNVFGGTGAEFGVSKSNKLFQCDLRSLKWEEVEADGDVPIPQYGQGLVLDDKHRQIYVIGGTTGHTYTMDVHKLDIVKKSWKLICCNSGAVGEPRARYRHEVAYDGDNIYIFGGGTNDDAFELNTVPVFNFESLQWSALETKPGSLPSPDPHARSDGDVEDEGEDRCDINGIPKRRKCHAAVQIDDDVYISGGWDHHFRIYDDIWRFNIPTREWHLLPQRIPTPLAFHAACVTPAGCMYTFGGVTNMERSVRTNKVFKIWLKIPKLKEICWEAILSLGGEGGIHRKSSKELMELGVPYEFAKRAHPLPPSGKCNCDSDSDCDCSWSSGNLEENKNGSCCIQ